MAPRKLKCPVYVKTRQPQIKKARLEQTVEFALKGVPNKDIASLMGVSDRTIKTWTKQAAEQGIVDTVRQRLMDHMLPKAVNVYDEILSQSADEISTKKIVKAQELRLKAARDIATGLGALRKNAESLGKVKQVIDLDGYYQISEARKLLNPEPEQPALTSHIIDGELINEQHAPPGEYRLCPESEQISSEEARNGVQRQLSLFDNEAVDWAD